MREKDSQKMGRNRRSSGNSKPQQHCGVKLALERLDNDAGQYNNQDKISNSFNSDLMKQLNLSTYKTNCTQSQ